MQVAAFCATPVLCLLVGWACCRAVDVVLMAEGARAQVLSTVITVGLLVGGAYLWISASSKDQPSSRSDSSSGGDDSEDPVAAARRIMDKYK